ncbi:hypothetical protein C0708_22020 [Aeromonas caviae]|nr:hypothetical protein C0708_22020 [Aeromonas caviae]
MLTTRQGGQLAAPTPSVELQGAGADDTYNRQRLVTITADRQVTLSAGTQVVICCREMARACAVSGQVTAEMLKDGLNVEVPVSGSRERGQR